MLKRRIRIALVFCAVLVLATVGGAIHLATGVRSEGHGVEITVVQGDPSVLDDVEISAGCMIPAYNWDVEEVGEKQGGYVVNYEVAFADGNGTVTTEVAGNQGRWEQESGMVWGHLRYTYPKLSYGRYVFTGDQIDVDYHVVDVDGTELLTTEGKILENYISFSADSRIPVYYQSIQVGYGDYKKYIYREGVRSVACLVDGKTYFFMGDMLSPGYHEPNLHIWADTECACFSSVSGAPDRVERFEDEPGNCNVEDVKYTVNSGLYVYDGENVAYACQMENAKDYRNYNLFYNEEAKIFVMFGQRGTEVLMHIWPEGEAEMTELLLGTTEGEVATYNYCVGEDRCYAYYAYYCESKGRTDRLICIDIKDTPKVLWTSEILGEKEVHISSAEKKDMGGYYLLLGACCVGDRIYLCQVNSTNYGTPTAELLVIENGELIFEGIISLPLAGSITEAYDFYSSYRVEDAMFPVSVSQGYLRITDVSITPKK